MSAKPLRIGIVLPGLHRVNRGAETAFESVGRELARRSDCEVTLFGSGESREDEPYRFRKVSCIPRECFEGLASLPALRSDTAYEELTFAGSLLRRFRPAEFDVSVTCSYPWCNWVLRGREGCERNSCHIFVTQNGDWAPRSRSREFRWFGCDGLVATNPVYYERNRDRWPTVLIPNGVDPARFFPGKAERYSLELPEHRPVVLMVSALIASKRVLEGIEAVAALPDVHMVVAGDGPMRAVVEAAGRRLLPGRFTQVRLPRERMPELYRAADAFLHMSLDEPSANSYIEALATGLPIVTHDRDVTRWTLEDVAWLVNTEDGEVLRTALSDALASKYSDRVERQRELVDRRFTWKGIAAAYSDFLHARFADTSESRA